jgi:hypothetical protein
MSIHTSAHVFEALISRIRASWFLSVHHDAEKVECGGGRACTFILVNPEWVGILVKTHAPRISKRSSSGCFRRRDEAEQA